MIITIRASSLYQPSVWQYQSSSGFFLPNKEVYNRAFGFVSSYLPVLKSYLCTQFLTTSCTLLGRMFLVAGASKHTLDVIVFSPEYLNFFRQLTVSSLIVFLSNIYRKPILKNKTNIFKRRLKTFRLY